jgi:tetratricopeptide (TPR) repeat protein
VHYERGNWDAAVADYSAAIKLDPENGEAFNNRAWTHYRAGRPSQALADADTAVRMLGTEAYVWDTRAHIYARLGNREAAISDFRAALAIDPANAASKAGLASLGVN